MADAAVSDAGVAVMCDIARGAGLDLDADKRAVVNRLIADGYVEELTGVSKPKTARFAVTSKGQKMLDQRGVGVNES